MDAVRPRQWFDWDTNEFLHADAAAGNWMTSEAVDAAQACALSWAHAIVVGTPPFMLHPTRGEPVRLRYDSGAIELSVEGADGLPTQVASILLDGEDVAGPERPRLRRRHGDLVGAASASVYVTVDAASSADARRALSRHPLLGSGFINRPANGGGGGSPGLSGPEAFSGAPYHLYDGGAATHLTIDIGAAAAADADADAGDQE
jgi:hypothetical protein